GWRSTRGASGFVRWGAGATPAKPPPRIRTSGLAPAPPFLDVWVSVVMLSSVFGRNAPDARGRLAGLEHEHALAGSERVGRGCHRLDGGGAAPDAGDRVARERAGV